MISPKALKMIAHHEGTRYKPYRCPAALWTVGVGHVLYPAQGKLPMADRLTYPIKPEDNRVWSKDEVNALLEFDLKRFESGVRRYCPAIATQGQFDALVSFSFNVGLGALQRSSIRMKTNRGDFEGAADDLMKWTKAGGKVLPGLVKRRTDERLLYLTT